MIKRVWLTISGGCVYRLYERGNGVLGQITRQERGEAEVPFSEVLPLSALADKIDWIASHSVEMEREEAAREAMQ